MIYFTYGDVKAPLSCITGMSYNRAGNIVPNKDLSCKCTGINPIQIQLQITLNASTCFDESSPDSAREKFTSLARQFSNIVPNKIDEPQIILIGNDVIVPQMKFMLISTNITYQSDRLGHLQEVNVNWTLSGSKVITDENRKTELKNTRAFNAKHNLLLPHTVLHCNSESIDCAYDVSIAEFKLSGFYGTIQLLLGDTYQKIDRKSWLAEVNNSTDAYFTVEGYGNYYISKSYMNENNWITFDLTKFSKKWYQKRTKTFISRDGTFTLSDLFDDDKEINVKSKAKFKYFKYDDTPLNVLYNLQDSLGYLIGIQNDKIYLYDAPKSIDAGPVYDYYLDNDLMTQPITKVILRDGYDEYSSGNNDGETFFVSTLCRVTSDASENVLRYVRFNQNMIVMTIPIETRLTIGSMITINDGNELINTICTEFDIDFLTNSMQLELHYVKR